MPGGVTPPAGYVRLGEYVQETTDTDAKGKEKKTKITIVVWQKQ